MNVLHKTAITLTPNHLDIITKKKKNTHTLFTDHLLSLTKMTNTLFNKKATALKAIAIFL